MPILPLRIPVEILPHGQGLALPAYETAGAAGMDVAAAVEASLELAPRARALVPTGLVLAIPAGYEVQVRPRSGWAWKHGITCLNAPGTIDSDYRGELKVLLINHGDEPVVIERGMRIAQLVVAPVTHARLVDVCDLDAESGMARMDETARGAGGFGHTGH